MSAEPAPHGMLAPHATDHNRTTEIRTPAPDDTLVHGEYDPETGASLLETLAVTVEIDAAAFR